MEISPESQSKLKAKTVAESKVEVGQLMQPTDANLFGNVHGGTIMRLVDNAGSIAAFRHAHHNIVTASVDRIDFLTPVFIGNLVTLKASVNYVGKSSMEVGVRVEAECLITGVKAHCASAFLTFVALDDHGKPYEVPGLIPETPDEKRRYAEGQRRHAERLKFVKKSKEKAPICIIPRPKF